MSFQKLIALLLIYSSTGALAVPYTWTIPSTSLSDGTFISGAFTFDAANSVLSAVNIVKTGTPGFSYTTPAAVSGGYIRAQTDSASGGYLQAVFINISSLPQNGGAYSASIGMGRCWIGTADVVAGICQNASSGPNGPAYVTATTNLSGVLAIPLQVPTLGDYAKVMLTGLMAWGALRTLRKRVRA